MKIAVEGCCHGQLDAIFGEIAKIEERNGYKVDLLLICGDFQAMRNHQDLQCMAVPQKYRHLGDFHRYYTGEKKAPILTLVIGGNHEASNYMWELYHGGWLAPNIYFMGHAGCVQVNGLRIAGASGIFKKHDFHMGHHEKLPYTDGDMRSIYHIREYNVCRLSLLSTPSVFLSHDWPSSIEHHGDLQTLLRRKPHFRGDIQTGSLGSPPMMGLLRNLKPQWWFAGHMHIRFAATVVHEQRPPTASTDPVATNPEGDTSIARNPDEIAIEDDEVPTSEQTNTVVEATGPVSSGGVADDGTQTQEQSQSTASNPDEIVLDEEIDLVEAPAKPVPVSQTNFVALDKCLPKRQFLEIIDMQQDPSYNLGGNQWKASTPRLIYDPEWLAITRAFHPFMSLSRNQLRMPDERTARELVSKEFEWVRKNIGKDGIYDVADCQTFCMTAAGPGQEGSAKMKQPPAYTNPQTVAFCNMLQLDNKVNNMSPGA